MKNYRTQTEKGERQKEDERKYAGLMEIEEVPKKMYKRQED